MNRKVVLISYVAFTRPGFRLRRYFRRMGFVRLGRTPYYALPMLTSTPAAEELLKPE